MFYNCSLEKTHKIPREKSVTESLHFNMSTLNFLNSFSVETLLRAASDYGKPILGKF